MSNLYETQRLVDEYLLFHYGQDHEILPWENGPVSALRFPVRTVTGLLPAGPVARALDIGCAVGRSSFELSKTSQEVIGIDYSHAFIHAAQAIQTQGRLPYQITREGHTTEPLTAHLPEDIHAGRVTFQQGDAMDLPATLGTFDLVHAANLVCRLTEPLRFLEPRESITRRLHATADYSLMHVRLYEDIAHWGRVETSYDYPVRVNGRYVMSPSPIPAFDNPKLHRSPALQLFGAGREKRIYAIPPHTEVKSLDFEDHPFAVQRWREPCALCGSTGVYLDEVILDDLGGRAQQDRLVRQVVFRNTRQDFVYLVEIQHCRRRLARLLMEGG